MNQGPRAQGSANLASTCREGRRRALPGAVAALALVLLAAGAGAAAAQPAVSDSLSAGGIPALPVEAAAGRERDRAGDVAPPPDPVKAPEAPAVNYWSTGVNATGAVLMTPLFPGWGQLYADGGWRAALAFGAEMYFWSNLLTRDRQARRDLVHAATLPVDDFGRSFAESQAAEHHEQMKDFVWWSGGALLIIALDAYVGAHLFNFDRDAVPVPDRWDDVFGPVGSGPAVNAGAGPQVTVFQWRKGF